MRLTMDTLGGGGVRRMDETEGGAIALVEPIGHVFYAVSILDVDVPAVRLGDIIRLQAAQVVAVHENRHAIPPVGAAGKSHFTAVVMFAGSGFDLRLAFHGALETTIRQAPWLVRTCGAPKNGGKYLFLAATVTDPGLKRSGRCYIVRTTTRRVLLNAAFRGRCGQMTRPDTREGLTTCASL
jgi:hypothetical protein